MDWFSTASAKPARMMTFQEYGMSPEFRKKSYPAIDKDGWEPFFKRDANGQVYQNMKCVMSWVDFNDHYKKYLTWK